MARRPPTPGATDVVGGVERIMRDEQVVYFPIKHYSPACAYQVQRLIEDLRPAAVLVEGPDDATALIPHLVHPETSPPLTIFSAYVDRRNRFGLNGRLSPSVDVPSRFRSWWPMADFCPEYTALRAGHAVGARLAFIDVPVPGRIPFTHARRLDGTEVVGDQHLATSAYFDALARKQHRRDFEEFWRANLERPDLPNDDFRRRVLTFAWCARYAGSEPGTAPGDANPLDRDGTLTRECHMRWHIDRTLKALKASKPAPTAPPANATSSSATDARHANRDVVVVVTGAFHSVALPFTKGRKAKFRVDKNLDTLLTPYSFAALARLYHMARTPGYEQLVWQAMSDGVRRPYDHAAMELLVRIMRAAREEGLPVSTADAVGAWDAAQRLAALRGNPEVTAHDLLDACRMGYVKGDERVLGGAVARIARGILVGHAQGHLTPEAGVLPLLGDFRAEARRHRVDLSGVEKTTRLDLHRQDKHRLKSAFLHRCAWLAIPMFGTLDPGKSGTRRYFKGPDPVAGTNLHLITETWALRWRESVDDRLVELCVLGANIAQAAAAELDIRVAQATGDAAESSAMLLQCARMMLVERFDSVLDVVDDAIEADQRFTHLVDALDHFVLLHAYRGALANHGRLAQAIAGAFRRAVRLLPAIARVESEALPPVLERLLTLSRHAVTFDATELGTTNESAYIDRTLLVGALRRLAEHDETSSALRGASYGLLHGFGAAREQTIAAALSGYLEGSAARRLLAGGFLDGLFQASRAVFMRSPRLLEAINGALAELDWETFKALLPDMRRAFTRFIPSELDRIGARVAEGIGLDESQNVSSPLPAGLQRVAAALDARVEATLGE